MGIRFPLKTVLDVFNDAPGHGGPASVSGGVAHTFNLPQDTDNIVVKLIASVVGGGVSAVLQTTDDGGTTWYDVARTSIVSNAVSENAQWLSAPVIGSGMRTGVVVPSVVAAGSVVSFGSIAGAIGSAAASTLGQREVSGLPILSSLGRIFLQYTAAVSSIQSERVQVKVNSESGTP